MQKLMKKSLLVILVICLLVPICSCNDKKMQGEDTNKNDLQKIDVYVVGNAMYVASEEDTPHIDYYFTNISIGDYENCRIGLGQEGHLWFSYLKNYERISGNEVNITFFEYPELLEQQLILDIENGTGPDLILNTYSSYADYYSFMEQGCFCDLSSYMDSYEMYSSNSYFENVLSAGILDQNQYIVPILFNINALMSSKENQNKNMFYLNQDMNLEEIMDEIIRDLNETQEGEYYQTITEQVCTADFLGNFLYSSSGSLGVDYRNKKVTLNEDFFKKLCLFSKALYKQQFRANWYEYVEESEGKFNWSETIKEKYRRMDIEKRNEAVINNCGYVLTGGGSVTSWMHSSAMEVTYYESRFGDIDEEFVCIYLPKWNEEESYVAHVSAFAAVPITSDAPETAFELIKFLMDQDYSPKVGLSINRQKTNDMIETLKNTSYEIDNVFGHISKEDYKKFSAAAIEQYRMDMMSENTAQQLYSVLDDVDSAVLPNWPIYGIMLENINLYSLEKIDLDQAYLNTVVQLEEYLKKGYLAGEVYY